MATLQQWRAAIGGFALRTGSTKWRPTCASRSRTGAKQKFHFSQEVEASASIKAEGIKIWATLCLSFISLLGLKYLWKGFDGMCGKLFTANNCFVNGTIFCIDKIGGIFSLFLACISKLHMRIFIPIPGHYVVIPLRISSLTSLTKLLETSSEILFRLHMKFAIFFMAFVFHLPILTRKIFLFFPTLLMKGLQNLSRKSKLIVIVMTYLALYFFLFPIIKTNEDTANFPSNFTNGNRKTDSSEEVSVAAQVIQKCLMTSGDVELNPGPQTQGGCNYCAKSLGFSTFGPAVTNVALKYIKDSVIWQYVNFKLSSGKLTNDIDEALTHVVKREYSDVIDGTSKLTLVPDAFLPKSGKTVHGWPTLFQHYGMPGQTSTDYKGEKAELVVFRDLVNFFTEKKATVIHSHKAVSKFDEGSQGIPIVDFVAMDKKIEDDLVAMFGSVKKTYKLDEIDQAYQHENDNEQKEKLSELLHVTKNILEKNEVDALEWLKARELRQIIYANQREMDFLVLFPEIKTVFVFEIKSPTNAKTLLGKGLDQIKFSKDYMTKIYGEVLLQLDSEWNFCGVLVFPNVQKLPQLGTCSKCKDFIVIGDVNFTKWLENIVSSRQTYDYNSYMPSYVKLFTRIIGYISMIPMGRNEGSTELHKAISGTTKAAHTGSSSDDPCDSPAEDSNPSTDLQGKDRKKFMEGKPLGCSSYVLFLNKLQIALFNIRRLFMIADYGTGKSTLISSLARRVLRIEMDKDPKDRKQIFIISMAATNPNDNDKAEPFDFILDIALKNEYSGFPNINVLSIVDLMTYYRDRNPGMDENIDVYILLEYFMEQNKNGHFLVDEICINQAQLSNRGDPRNKLLDKCFGHLESNSYFWIASKSNSFCDVIKLSTNDESNFDEFCSKIVEIGFSLQRLDINMRNSPSISSIEPSHIKPGGLLTPVTHIKPGISPEITMDTGLKPIYIHINEKEICPAVEYGISNILNIDASKENNSVVILCQRPADVQKIFQHLLNRGFMKQNISVFNPNFKFDPEFTDVTEFLPGNKGILITLDVFFTGCESNSIIYTLHHESSFQRHGCLRAISHLIVITSSKQLFPSNLPNIASKDKTFKKQQNFVINCFNGNINKVSLIVKDIDLNASAIINKNFAYTGVTAAISNSKCEVVKTILPHVDLNRKDGSSSTPLVVATETSCVICVKLLLSDTRLKMVDNSKFVQLYFNGNIDRAKTFVTRFNKDFNQVEIVSASTGSTSLNGFTAAIVNGHVDVIEFLIAMDPEDENGLTYLHHSCIENRPEITDLLLKKSYKHINKMDTINGRTALMMACDHGNTECVKLLLGNKATDANLQDQNQATSLMIAAQHGNAECVKLLLGNKEIDVNLQDQNQATSLMIAAQHGNADCVKLLLDNKATNVNLQDQNQATSLMIAVQHGNAECVQLLLDNKATNSNLQNQNLATSLILAAQHGNAESVQLLLDNKSIDVNLRGQNQATALIIATQHGNAECVKILLDTP